MTRLAILLLAVSLPALADGPVKRKDGFWAHPTGLHYRSHMAKSRNRPGLLVICHGNGGYLKPLENEYAKAAQAAGFVVLVPKSINFSRMSSTPDKSWVEEDDKKLIKLTKDVVRWYRIDRTKVYGLGLGNGNTIGNLAFTHPKLFNGAVGLVGGPGMIGEKAGYYQFTDAMKKRLGLLLLVGSTDPNKQVAEDSAQVAKDAGLKDVEFKEYPGKGASIIAGSGKLVATWLKKDRYKFEPGAMVQGIDWKKTRADAPKLVYVTSKNKKHRKDSMTLEWDVLSLPFTVARAKGLECKQLDLASGDALLTKLGARGKAPKGPVVAFLDKAGDVKLLLDAKAVEKHFKKAKGRSYEQKWPRFAAALEKAIKGAVGEGGEGELK